MWKQTGHNVGIWSGREEVKYVLSSTQHSPTDSPGNYFVAGCVNAPEEHTWYLLWVFFFHFPSGQTEIRLFTLRHTGAMSVMQQQVKVEPSLMGTSLVLQV